MFAAVLPVLLVVTLDGREVDDWRLADPDDALDSLLHPLAAERLRAARSGTLYLEQTPHT